ncbi:MAG TPA: penicillin-binding protein 1C [Chryseosolibacter sp.]|nr:penicillin-binding protein 1C [Chryseosolibacter sp.]
MRARVGRWFWRYKVRITIFVIVGTLYWLALPATLFEDPYSPVLLSRKGELLSASIAQDGQWRFPVADSVPTKFAEAIIAFEDKRFGYHPGVDPLSVARALRQNLSSGKIISGGSTITMQVIRLSRKNRPRTIFEKLYEIVLATRLELQYSKPAILRLYSAHAPFGGNVVGLEAACWRYFGTDARDLSWAQAAMLAVLPNSPSLIHPGRNRAELKMKRDRLLDKLHAQGKIDLFSCSLAKEEPIPDAPHPLPRLARHLLGRAVREHDQRKFITTVDLDIQQQVEKILEEHSRKLESNHIHNGAALVLEVKTGNVLAYAGNFVSTNAYENDVDIINSARSTGSILKPFLYAAMMDEGKILPKTLLPDIPVLLNGFAPRNFSHAYDGAVPADEALIRSLNVPSVHLLREYRYEKFHSLLKEIGISTLRHHPDHYGLSLILGGAEATLWDVTGAYASMSRTMNTYFEFPGKERYYKTDFHPPTYLKEPGTEPGERTESSFLSAAAIYFTFEALKEVYRPGEETGWQHFSDSKNIAWKTGTSFGFRDGWAVGVTPDFAVGVWIGNADGEGRPGLTGTGTAAPVMFDIFSKLPHKKGWFTLPLPETREVQVCKITGHRKSQFCDNVENVHVPASGLVSSQCPYHKRVHLSRDGKFRVHDQCSPVAGMQDVNWFVLPPVQEYYYKHVHGGYKPLPSFRSDCEDNFRVATMDLLYPKQHAKVFVPRELGGNPGRSVFELAHRDPKATVYWHLDGKYIGSTTKVHHLALNPPAGKHKLTIVDGHGAEIHRDFEVISGL